MYSRNNDLLIGGCMNGLVNLFDTRTFNGKHVSTSSYDHSHTNPIFDITWLQSKTHSEVVSVSTDGNVFWWDTRQLASGPIDSCSPAADFVGVTCIEWQQEAGPTKYLVGTEQGTAYSLNKKPKKPVEVGGWFGIEEKGGFGRHFGQINTIKRNMHHPKFFMTVGDNSIKLWLEEIKGPIMQTAPSPRQLTCGGWSPSRASVFFAGRFDGSIDFYDYSTRMDGLAYSHKISDLPVTCIAGESKGRFLAAGDPAGTITMVRLSDELTVPISGEKLLMGTLLDREQRRERNLDTIRKQHQQITTHHHHRPPSGGAAADMSTGSRRIDQQQYIDRETDWLSQLGIRGGDISIQTGT